MFPLLGGLIKYGKIQLTIMKILFLNTNIGYDGASKMIVWVANQCATEGNDVTIVTYRDTAVNQFISKKIKHVHFNLECNGGLGDGLLSTVRFLRRYIKNEAFDVAVAFLPPSQIRLSLACLGLKTKLLYSQRGDPFQKGKTLKLKIVEKIYNWLFSFADFYVFQTIGAQQYYSKAIQDRSVVIPNPINRIERTVERKGNIERKIVCVARLDLYQKRQDILIEAFIKIEKRYPDVVLELYGDGSKFDEEKLHELSSNHSQIKFMGKMNASDIVDHIQNAAIGVLSSDFEGIPNALLEYMSLGIPSISTDCSPGGAAMLIKNNINGLLVDRGNATELAEAMSFMLDNVEKAEKMGIEGTKVVEDYSENRIQTQWISALNKM